MGSSGAVRQRWVDHVKCLAILAVVLGHTYVIGNPIHSFVYSFHIPLFLSSRGISSRLLNLILPKWLLDFWFRIC